MIPKKDNLLRKSMAWVLYGLLLVVAGCFMFDYLISQIRIPTANIFKSAIRTESDSQGRIISIDCPITQYPTYDAECEVRERFLNQFDQLAELKRLSIYGGLTKFPTAVLQLKDLEHLSLSIDTVYTDSPYSMSVPPDIGRLTNLRGLSLTEVENIPSEIEQLEKLESLLLHGDFTTIPPEVWSLPNLRSLNMSSPKLSTISPNISQLGKLEKLYIVGNFTTVPPEIWTLSNLEVLLIKGNLTSLPSEIENLTLLRELHLPKNDLKTLPPEVYQITSLEVLNLQNNNLTTLSPEIGQLTNLYRLDLSANNLNSLPPEIGVLTNLNELRIRGNSITPQAYSTLNGREEISEYLQNFAK